MQISNTFREYSQEDLVELIDTVKRMQAMSREMTSLLEKELKTPSLTNGNNVVKILPEIRVEFLSLAKEKLPLHEVIALYYHWHEESFEMMKNNIGFYDKQKIIDHTEEVLKICRSFNSLFKDVK